MGVVKMFRCPPSKNRKFNMNLEGVKTHYRKMKGETTENEK